MCTVKKFNLDLKRSFVSNHCVATLKQSDLVDMCLFSGEGKPTLLGGYVLSREEAADLGMGLMHTSAIKAGEEHRKKIINDSIAVAYQLLQDVNAEQAQKLRDLFDIKIIEPKQAKEAHGYIG